MIAYLRGIIFAKTERFVVLDVGGVGYQVFCAKHVLEEIGEKGEEAELFTTLFVRENTLELYGFSNMREQELFSMLVGISGIGPRAAQAITGIGATEDVVGAIERGDEKFFAGIPGVGPKRIKKVILELSGKLPQKEEKERIKKGAFRDAYRALVSLGFSSQEAKEALQEIPNEFEDSKEIVRQALRLLGKQP